MADSDFPSSNSNHSGSRNYGRSQRHNYWCQEGYPIVTRKMHPHGFTAGFGAQTLTQRPRNFPLGPDNPPYLPPHFQQQQHSHLSQPRRSRDNNNSDGLGYDDQRRHREAFSDGPNCFRDAGVVQRSGQSEYLGTSHELPVSKAYSKASNRNFERYEHLRPFEFSSEPPPSYAQKEPIHWDKALAHPDSETGGTRSLTKELISCGARELEQIFEIWEERREKAREANTTPKLEFNQALDGLDQPDSRNTEARFFSCTSKSELQVEKQPEVIQTCQSQFHNGCSGLSQQRIFQDIVNRFLNLIPGPHLDDEGFYFLDVGCRPGSFASFLLSRNQRAIGVGVCPLPPESMSTSGSEAYYTQCQSTYFPFSSRFKLHFFDIAKLDLRPPGEKYRQVLSSMNITELPPDTTFSVFKERADQAAAGCPVNEVGVDFDSLKLKKLPKELLFGPKESFHMAAGASSQKFNLVILDNYPCSSSSSPDLLLISQLLLALQSLTPNRGGVLVVRLKHPESVVTAKILYMLDTLSFTVAVIKPRDMLGDSEDPGCFYAIAQNVGCGPHGHKFLEVIEELRKLWGKLLMRSMHSRILLKSGFDVAATSVERRREIGEVEVIGRRESSVATSRMGGLKEEDLDFIIYTHELKGTRRDYLTRLAALGEMVWTRQLEMILMAMKNRR